MQSGIETREVDVTSAKTLVAEVSRSRADAALLLVEKTTDARALDQIAVNADKQGYREVAQAAVKKKLQLAGRDHADPLERELEQAVAAREHLLFLKHGKAQQASYTRRMMKTGKPVREIITDWVMDGNPTSGFRDFVEAGIPEFAAENIAIRHPDEFPKHVVEAARRRLREFGQET